MKDMGDNQRFFYQFIQLLPLGCACYQAIRTEKGEVLDFFIHACNEAYLAINGVKKAQVIGKCVSDAFPQLDPAVLTQLKSLGAQLCSGKCQRLVRFISIYDHLYRVSAFSADPALFFTIYEDVQSQRSLGAFSNAVSSELIGQSLVESIPNMSLLDPPVRREPADKPPHDDGPVAQARKDMTFLFPDTFHIDKGNAFRDSLTGLYDRCYAVEAFELLSNQGKLPLSIIMGDVNGLKQTNDVLGYQAGDEALIKIARIFHATCRATDLVARWSGDEFLAILPNTSREEAQNLAHRLQRAFREARDSSTHISVALGYATRESKTLLTDTLFQEAETSILRKKLLMGQSHRNGTINLLLSVLYEKSTETQEHSERMATHCHNISKTLNLSDEQINDLILLAMLHDIGKVGINSEILRKPGPLTKEERHEIQLHPEIGHRITQSIPELSQVSEYILTHHEWWNGQGYPYGLHGKQIPIPSRIIAVVDAYDVMITGRNYRPARRQAEVVAELKRCAGTQFDPTIVDVFTKLLCEAPQCAR